MNDRIRVSVVMPVYNGERYLREAVQSVLGQTMGDFELIVVDDGSTDQSASIIRDVSSDPRVVPLFSPHQGISAALNIGIRAARSELIARLDSDDVMYANRLERQLAFLADNPSLGGAASDYEVIDQNGTSHGTRRSRLTTVQSIATYLDAGGYLIFPHPTMIFRKAAWEAAGGYLESYDASEDVDLFVRMIDLGYPLVWQPETLIRFRVHSRSITSRSTRKQTHLNTLIFQNRARRLAGQKELTAEEYFERYRRSGWWAKLRMEARIQSALLTRRRDMLLLKNKKGWAFACLALAALCSPERVAGKIKRDVIRAVRERRPLPGPTLPGPSEARN